MELQGGQLIQQMMFELSCAIILALIAAFCFIIIARPAFSGLLDIKIEMSQLMFLFAVCGIGMMVLILFISFILFWRLSHLAMRPASKRKTNGQPILRHMAITLQLAVSMCLLLRHRL